MTKKLKKPMKMCWRKTTLRFTPTAWAKLLFLRDYGDAEVGGFGITSSNDLLLVEDIRLVKQICSPAHVAFDDDSVADFFDEQVDHNRRPEQFARIWVHTHPGDCPLPSGTDEATFKRVFGRSDWALMFILAQGGQSYARLRFNLGPGAEMEIPVEIDYQPSFPGCLPNDWEQEYLTNVQTDRPHQEPDFGSPFDERRSREWYDEWLQYTESEL